MTAAFQKNLTSGVYLDNGLDLKDAKALYRRRRMQLSKACKHLPLCITGHSEHATMNRWAPEVSLVVQSPLIAYLTGIHQRDVILYMDLRVKEEVLFLPQKSLKKEFWDGYCFGVGDKQSERTVKSVTGFKTIMAIEAFEAFIEGRFKTKTIHTLGLFWNVSSKHPKKIFPDEHAKFYKKIALLLKKHRLDPNRLIHNIAKEVWHTFLVIDDIELRHVKQAIRITSEAFKSFLREHKTRRFLTETHVNGYLEGYIKKRTPFGMAFATIVASGSNATVLHYKKNDDKIYRGELLLIDFGAKCYQMAADISRTFPVNGRFNPLQKLLYQIVLAAQKEVETKAIEGVTIAELNERCWSYIQQALRKEFTEPEGTMKLPYDKAPHGVSHLIGRQVHEGDPYGDYKKTPLREGSLISNEPGVYGEFEKVIDGKRYHEVIGIRIEDNLYITKTGCLNLTRHCPKSIRELEALMA